MSLCKKFITNIKKLLKIYPVFISKSFALITKDYSALRAFVALNTEKLKQIP
jgi:hypothetical protein